MLGNAASRAFESFGATDQIVQEAVGVQTSPTVTHGAGGLLDYPQYTRPAAFAGAAVPQVLVDGNHEQVRQWRRERALEKTWRNRPELLERAALSAADRVFLARLRDLDQ